MKDEILGAWVSKYALSQGVYHARVRDCGDNLVNVLKPDGTTGWGYLHKGEWHLTRDEAVAQAEKLRKRKITSVERQLARLRALSFKLAAAEASKLSPDLKASQQPTVSK